MLVVIGGVVAWLLVAEAQAQDPPKLEMVPVPQIGHSDMISAVAFSRDGTRVLSGSDDSTLKLWDVPTGALLRTCVGHSGAVSSVAFSPDGTRLLSGSADKTLKLWDAATGALLRTIKGHSGRVWSVAFSPDGSRMLSGSEDNTLMLWDTATGAPIGALTGHSHLVSSVAFSPDGTRVVSASYDGTLKLWDAFTRRLLRTIEGHSDQVWSVAFSPDGAHLLSGSTDFSVKLWDAATGALLRAFTAHSGTVWSVAFSPDSARLISASADKTLKIWEVSTGELLRTFEGHTDQVKSATFSPDGTTFLSGSADKTLKLWGVTDGEPRTFAGYSDWIWSVAFSPDGARLLSGSADNTLKLWDAATGVLLRTIKGHSGRVWSVAFSPDGSRVVSGGEDKALKLWDATSGKLLREFKGHVHWVWSVAFSPDGSRVLSGSDDSTLKLWDVATGKLLRTFRGHSDTIWSVAFSPNGGRILSGSGDQTIRLWDAATGNLLRTFQLHSGQVRSVAFSPDHPRFLSGGADKTIRLWDITSGALLGLSIAGRGGQWLAMTERGFYAASRRDPDMLAIVRGLDVTTIEQVYQSLFNPDLVREALAGDPEREVARASAAMNLEIVVDSGPPPVVAIAPLAEGGTVTRDVATIAARITDRGKGIGRIEWRVNGVTAAVSPKPPGSGPDYAVIQELALDPGDNLIEVVAHNASNLLASLAARTTIKFTGPADQTRPRLHVLAIGIDAYQSNIFSRLSFAGKDARAFGAAMEQAAGGLYEEARVTYAIDEAATATALDDTIQNLSRVIHPRDTFILFVSAHGYSRNGRFFLIPQDYPDGLEAMETRAIGQDRFQDWIANSIRARKVLILLDTCESGALVAGHTTSRLNAPTAEAAIGRLHEATGRPILTAAASGRAAFEAYKQQHGIFTYALLDALKNGDRNRNGTIELSELVAHVQAKVAEIGVELNAPTRGVAAMSEIQAQQTAASGRGFAPVSKNSRSQQAARFGSRGEDFALVRRLQ